MVRHADARTLAEVTDLVARHPQSFDNRAGELMATAYTPAVSFGEPPPGRVFFPHHTTNTVVHVVDEDTLRVWSKYLVVRGDGTAGSGDYQDTVVRTPDGWRISDRQVSRGNRPDSDVDGPSTRTFTEESWLAQPSKTG